MSVEPERLRLAKDVRGVVFEPLSAGVLPLQRNVHVVLTQPGEVRGNHMHRVAAESCVVQGPAWVRLREGESTWDHWVPEGEVWRFKIPPGTAHAIRHAGAGVGLIVAFSTRAHDPADPDTYAVVLIRPGEECPVRPV